MPRPQTEAAATLERYKLMVEKTRLEQELSTLDARRQQICDRLNSLTQQLEGTPAEIIPMAKVTGLQPQSDDLAGFDTLFLEY